MTDNRATPGSVVDQRFVSGGIAEALGPLTLEELRAMAAARRLKPSSRLRNVDSDVWFDATDLPWLFSDRRWLVAVALSFVLGTLGIDRFYLGYTWLGLAKLATIGGLGIWALVDCVLIALHMVRDSDGLPLR